MYGWLSATLKTRPPVAGKLGLPLNFSYSFLKKSFAAERGLLFVAACVLAAGTLSAQGPSAKPAAMVAPPRVAPADAIANFPVTTDPVLMQAMETELHRAMSELGSAQAASAAKPAASLKDTPSPKPYFVSFTVEDNQNVTIQAQYGAIAVSNATHTRT